jgi:hypothetical protein
MKHYERFEDVSTLTLKAASMKWQVSKDKICQGST